MKKIVLGFLIATYGLNVIAGGLTDFVGTWKKESSTGPYFFVIKKEGSNLFAIQYSKNDLTQKITERRFPATYHDDKLRIPGGNFDLDGHLENNNAVLIVIGDKYEKLSSSTSFPMNN